MSVEVSGPYKQVFSKLVLIPENSLKPKLIYIYFLPPQLTYQELGKSHQVTDTCNKRTFKEDTKPDNIFNKTTHFYQNWNELIQTWDCPMCRCSRMPEALDLG